MNLAQFLIGNLSGTPTPQGVLQQANGITQQGGLKSDSAGDFNLLLQSLVAQRQGNGLAAGALNSQNAQTTAQTTGQAPPTLIAVQLPLVHQDAAMQLADGTPNSTTALQVVGADIMAGADASTEIGQLLLIYTPQAADQPIAARHGSITDRAMEALQALKTGGDASALLINLTPEDITQLEADLQAIKAGSQVDSDVIGGLGFLAVQLAPTVLADASIKAAQTIPPSLLPFTAPSLPQASASPQTIAERTAAAAGNKPTDGGQVNSLIQRGGGAGLDDLLQITSSADKFSALLRNAAAASQRASADGTAALPLDEGAAPPTTPVTGMTTNARTAQTGTGYAGNASLAGNSANQNNAANGTNAASTAGNTQTPQGALQNWQTGLDGSLFSSLGFDQDTLSAMGITGTSYQETGTQELTNLTTQARAATHQHPGTALVAASFSKIAGNPTSQIMTLRLDPPELGRVEIRMEFGPDRTMKATIVSEKAEAHFMLQRDAQVLERALQNAGLDTDSASLDFQMAGDGQNFSQDGRHDGSRNQAFAGDSGNAPDAEIIETTMNWNIDPETGHMHYNILV